MKTLKHYILFAAVILAASFAFSACGDDDDNNGGSETNYFKYAGQTYKLNSGLQTVLSQDQSTGYSIIGVNLLGGNLTYPGVNGQTGPRLYFKIKAKLDDTGALSPGTYTCPATTETKSVSTRYVTVPLYCVIFTSYTIGQDFTAAGEVSSGKLVVKKSGNIYTFDLKGTDANNNAITAHFKGEIPINLLHVVA